MAKLDMATVMDAIAAALVAGDCVDRAYGYPAATVQRGQAAVGYPENGQLGVTFGRGLDTATFPVWIVCGIETEEKTRDEVSRLVGSATDVKTAIESAMTQVDVSDFRIEPYPFTEGAYTAVRFDCEVLS